MSATHSLITITIMFIFGAYFALKKNRYGDFILYMVLAMLFISTLVSFVILKIFLGVIE